MQLWWILAHILVGNIVGASINANLVGEPGALYFSGTIIAFSAIGFSMGPLLAITQWLFIRRLVPKTQWLPGTIVGWWLGIPVAICLNMVLSILGILIIGPFTGLSIMDFGLFMPTLHVPCFFAFLGAVQCSALESQVVAAWRWIYISALGGAAGFTIETVFNPFHMSATIVGGLGWAGSSLITWHFFLKKISLLPPEKAQVDGQTS